MTSDYNYRKMSEYNGWFFAIIQPVEIVWLVYIVRSYRNLKVHGFLFFYVSISNPLL